MDSGDIRRPSEAATIGSTRSVPGAGAKAAPGNLEAILQMGQLVGGRFEIQEILGVGGMGAVYKAHDRDIDRIIALKCIRPDLASNPEVIHRFTQELLLARQIAHKNIIKIFDVRESGGLKFITMEYVDGRDLAGLLAENGKMACPRALEIIRQVCSGLAAAHAEGVVHRDLKPSNIMIDQQGRVVVMDFGIARAESGAGMTQTGAMMGTLQYMSPEQARGEKIDARSDVFAVGLILYQMITGQLPYQAETPLASLLKRSQEAAVPASDVDAQVPRSVSAIVSRCLERNVSQRYQSMQELIADLDILAGRRPESVYPAGAATQISLWKWIAIGGIALALVAAAIIGGLRFSRPGVQQASTPIKVLLADFDNGTADSVFDGTLESSFALAMEGAPFISSYNRVQAHKALSKVKAGATQLDEDNARLVAVREGINVIIAGSVTRQGESYLISCKAIDPITAKVIGKAESSAATKSAVLQTVAALAVKLRTLLGDTTPDSIKQQQEETFTSSSMEAAHEYALGQDMQWAGNWDKALAHYSRAVELDANMGRAYAGLAASSANMGHKAEAEKYYQMAMARIDRMSDREKYRTRGGYYLFTRQPGKAIEEYSALVKQYPADGAGYSNLALSYFYTRDMQKAMQEGRHAVEVSPRALLQRNNLALYAVYAGDYAAGATEAQAVLKENPAYEDAYGALAMAQTGLGNLADAQATYQKLQTISGRGASIAAMGMADVALYQGRDAEALDQLQKGVGADIAGKDPGAAAAKSIALSQAYSWRSDKRQSVAAADRALLLDQQPSVLFAAAESYIQSGEMAKAGKLAVQLSARIEPEPQVYGNLLKGRIALRKGEVKEALAAFDAAQKVTNTWLGHFYLGQAYLQANSFTEADSEFELCLKRRGEVSAVFLDDVPTFRLLPQVYYYLGRAQEGLKSPAAADSYRVFLNMQSGSGASSVLVADARKRLQPH